MKKSLRLTPLSVALVGALLAPVSANAFPGDLRVVNELPVSIKPWFRTACWAPGGITAAPTTWVDFGNIGTYQMFTWNMATTVVSKCRIGAFQFTYTVPGEPAPVGTPRNGRLTTMLYDSDSTYTIQAGGAAELSVLPAP